MEKEEEIYSSILKKLDEIKNKQEIIEQNIDKNNTKSRITNAVFALYAASLACLGFSYSYTENINYGWLIFGVIIYSTGVVLSIIGPKMKWIK